MTQFTVIIPARYASSRLPGKPLADIVGKPMIQHVLNKLSNPAPAELLLPLTMNRWLPLPKILVRKCA